jgi:hypothetical protein
MKINYVALIIILSIIGSVAYVVYDVNHRGRDENGSLWLTGSNVLFICYAVTMTVGGAGIQLTATGVKQISKKSSFQVAEGVFIRSERDYSGNFDERRDRSYFYIYEYYVDGQRYEYKDYAFVHNSETPKEHKGKVRLIYNPEYPIEVMTTKTNILYIVAGLICIVLALLLIWGATKVDMNKKYGGKTTTTINK